jgi:hypothetical protein
MDTLTSAQSVDKGSSHGRFACSVAVISLSLAGQGIRIQIVTVLLSGMPVFVKDDCQLDPCLFLPVDLVNGGNVLSPFPAGV